MESQILKDSTECLLGSQFSTRHVNCIEITSNTMQLKMCIFFASTPLRFAVSGISLLRLSQHIFPPNHPSWQESQTSVRTAHPYGVLGSCMPVNSSPFFQYVDEFPSTQLHLFIS